jgi:hypothetical protein
MSLNHSHYPSWLSKNKLFRWLFIWRKNIFSKTYNIVYGQNGEDLILTRLFPSHYKGVYIDVGCFHPKKYNNTYRLYKKGWRGINIDIDKIKIEAFNKIRPEDYNIAIAITNEPGEVKYYANGFYSPTTTLEKSFSQHSDRNYKQYYEKSTLGETLTNVIETSPFKNQIIDLLTVDVEGHDLVVLKSIDFNKYSPKVIAVETMAKNLTQLQDSRPFQFLIEKDYELINWVGMTLIWKKKNYE